MEDATITTTLPQAPAAAPRLWGALGAIALYGLIQFMAGLLMMIVYVITQWLRHPGIDLFGLLHDPQSLYLVIGISLPISSVSALLIFRAIYSRVWRLGDANGIGVVPIRASAFLLQVLLGIGAALLANMLPLLFGHAHPVHEQIVTAILQSSPSARLLLILSAVTLTPLIEEILFRGILLSALVRHLGVRAAMALDALLFALFHLPDLGFRIAGLLPLALLGLLCCWRRIRSGSIYASVAVHAGFNLLATMLLLVMFVR